MIARQGFVFTETRDICQKEKCLKDYTAVCGLQFWLREHGADITIHVQSCKEAIQEYQPLERRSICRKCGKPYETGDKHFPLKDCDKKEGE